MARQSINAALDKIREIMYAFTRNRRWSPSEKCLGNRATVHGATRHTSAALLLFRRGSDVQPPSESVIMEIQQRSGLKVFRQHYYHCDETAVRDGLEFATVPSPFKKQTRADSKEDNHKETVPQALKLNEHNAASLKVGTSAKSTEVSKNIENIENNLNEHNAASVKVGTSVEKKKCCYSPCPLPDGVGASDANEEVGEGSAAVAQDPKRFCSRNAIHSVTYVWDSFLIRTVPAVRNQI